MAGGATADPQREDRPCCVAGTRRAQLGRPGHVQRLGGPPPQGGGTAFPADPELSLRRLLVPEVLADPYPLYERLRAENPVYWDPYLHAWVVTRYSDVVEVLSHFSAVRAPTPDRLTM